ncbi:sugar ABC transporter ATP-binding protein [Microbacterium saccharophilum]|uniref:Sugar ABC transporter ATP-binding protein n=1 Tax=Microbacterium saccharophilum TaxID=1213358 RepID=A0A5C8I6A3_9MICO|nr:ATP-binding cassette domain-containing protein [Microbacterium saccharophilum]TXK14957.1 sugar ABC transporter ATP-binding protein [Microbacterium saccharophilum]GEP47355.1 ABC transporter ATP-binding protein [Microbacterium saccharophilum]
MSRDDTPVLELRGLTKRFQAVEALVDADLVVHRREVVALVGDNAAGKSTLARIVSGVYTPDAGTIRLDGSVTELPSPGSAFRQGVAAVFQELALAENLDVVANIFLGHEVVSRGIMDNDEMDRLARTYLDQLGGGVPLLHAPVADLSAGQRQCVAIARTLVGSPRLVVLDEPTASLSIAQTAQVLNYIEHLRELGVGVILISHSLSDVRAVADRIEVLRHGRNNGSFDANSSRYEDVIAAITGARRVDRAPGQVQP